MKKLLFFASDFKVGLSELLLDELISIHQAGCDYVAIAGDNEQIKGLWEKARSLSLNLIQIKSLDSHASFWKLVEQLKDICHQYKVEVAHVQNNWQLALISAIRWTSFGKHGLHNIDVVYTLHGFRHNNRYKAKVAQILIGTALGLFATHVQCMSLYLKRKFSMLSYKITVLPLGISEDCFRLDGGELESSSFLRMVYPAQFREGKNQDLVIRTFASYVARTTDVNSSLSLPGNGPLLADCKILAKKLGLEHRVVFPGFIPRNQVLKIIKDSHLAIVASNCETFGQCIVEPFVLGRPVLSTSVGIAPEIINDGVNGFIFKDEEELTELLVRLSANPSLVKTMGENNLRLRNAFRWETIIERYKQIFLV